MYSTNIFPCSLINIVLTFSIYWKQLYISRERHNPFPFWMILFFTSSIWQVRSDLNKSFQIYSRNRLIPILLKEFLKNPNDNKFGSVLKKQKPWTIYNLTTKYHFFDLSPVLPRSQLTWLKDMIKRYAWTFHQGVVKMKIIIISVSNSQQKYILRL